MPTVYEQQILLTDRENDFVFPGTVCELSIK